MLQNAITPESLLIRGRGGLGGKRSAFSDSPVAGPSKRAKTTGLSDSSRSGINISALRRENELYRVIEQLGGVANLQTKEIYEAHTALLDNMTRDGEPTSAPVGTRIDKRTAESTLKSLEDKGRIKMLKTSLISASGASKPACLLYFPNTPQEKLNEYIYQLSQVTSSVPPPAPVKTLEEPVDFGPNLRRSQRTSIPTTGETITEPPYRGGSSPQQASIDDSPEQRRRGRKRKDNVQTNAEAKAALQKKVEEARHQKEEDWTQLLNRIHPGTIQGTLAMHLRAVRICFMESPHTKDHEHWEGEIRKSIKETELAAKEIISRPQRLPTNFCKPLGPPPTVVNPPEKSIASLISQQGPPINQTTRSKGKGKEREEGIYVSYCCQDILTKYIRCGREIVAATITIPLDT